jgi:SAM-dependent methyltransferase
VSVARGGPRASRPHLRTERAGGTPAVQVTERLLSLLDHIGIERAHVATQIPGDVAGLAAAHAERLGGIVLCAPVRLDPEPFLGVAERVLMIAGEYGPTEAVTTRAWSRMPAAERLLLDNYEAQGWSDVVADCTGEIAGQMASFLARFPADAPKVSGEGSHAGISYRIEGSGPALILSPFFLSATQWDAAVPALSEHFTVIRLGGRHLGGVAALEDRASMPTYRAMFRSVVDLLAPKPGEMILDVGSGAGSLDRLLARWTGGANKITTVDASPYLLREAAALAAEEGLAIDFTPGNAEALPFPDSSFDCVFSVTVLEECDADKAIAEIVRVTKPGGRVGIVVRAIDLPQWWHLDLPDAIRAKVTPPPQSVGRGGVADQSLYRRMKQAGLGDVVCFPFLLTLDQPEGPIWRYREDHVLALLDADERGVWLEARAKAEAEGLLMMANPLHCAVGTKR